MDIDKCKGVGCIVKKKCLRYTSRSIDINEYYIEEPFKIDKGWFTCVMYYGKSSDLLLEQLKNIMNGSSNKKA
jgi:hypothetical protein